MSTFANIYKIDIFCISSVRRRLNVQLSDLGVLHFRLNIICHVGLSSHVDLIKYPGLRVDALDHASLYILYVMLV